MNDNDFAAKQAELLARLPEELRGAVSYEAYSSQHSGGNEEVLNAVSSLVSMLELPLKAYGQRMLNDGKHLVCRCEDCK